MANDDLLEHAKSTEDFYALLDGNVHSGSSEKEIDRAYRRAALKAHPDKHIGDPGAQDRFHKLKIAHEVLSDPEAKAAYDNARLAREARARQNAMIQGKRKTMYDDLLRGENEALKRKRDGGDDPSQEEMEMRRMAANNRQRRLDQEEARRKAREQEERKMQENEQQQPVQMPAQDTNGDKDSFDRAIKVTWTREGEGIDIDHDALKALFTTFGPIETILVRSDRKARINDEKKKRLCGSAVIEFRSIVGAHAAVTDSKRQSGGFWDLVPKVEWLAGKEPESLSATSNSPAAKPSFGATAFQTTKPSFGASSFASTRQAVPGPGPTLEEITLIRLRNAERKKLEEQIRAQEAENA